MTDRVFCPECEEVGKKSKVWPGAGTSTAVGYAPYYDEDGYYHNHDPNRTYQHMRCSKGHVWQETVIRSCPNTNCDWTNQ